mmetsp:Transcript_733/g.2792  ORF Transcript_733/g.2792 Transcript_733/m.2792 type:complete len:261 (-) Transcript_733:23-805(-)
MWVLHAPRRVRRAGLESGWRVARGERVRPRPYHHHRDHFRVSLVPLGWRREGQEPGHGVRRPDPRPPPLRRRVLRRVQRHVLLHRLRRQAVRGAQVWPGTRRRRDDGVEHDHVVPHHAQHACRARRGAREGNEAVLPRARRRNRRLHLRHAQRSRHHGPRGAHQRVRRPIRRPVRARVRRVRGQNHAQKGQARAHQGRREEEKVNDVSKSSRDAKRRRIHTKEGSELSSMDSHNIYPAPQRPAREYTHPVFKKLNGNKSD